MRNIKRFFGVSDFRRSRLRSRALPPLWQAKPNYISLNTYRMKPHWSGPLGVFPRHWKTSRRHVFHVFLCVLLCPLVFLCFPVLLLSFIRFWLREALTNELSVPVKKKGKRITKWFVRKKTHSTSILGSDLKIGEAWCMNLCKGSNTYQTTRKTKLFSLRTFTRLRTHSCASSCT